MLEVRQRKLVEKLCLLRMLSGSTYNCQTMPNIVLATSGSFGDLHPYLAIGVALKDRGHDVTVATSDFYRNKVLGEGLKFSLLRPNYVPMAGSGDVVRRAFDPYTGARFLIKQLVLPYVEETYQDLLKACENTDLLVIHPTLFPAPLVAEKLGLKWISVVLSPGVFVSAYDPPLLPPLPWMHVLRHLGPLPHKVLLFAMKKITRRWMRPIECIRRREGLRPVGRSAMHDDMFSPYGTLAWYSPLLGEPQKDWPSPNCVTGFPFYDCETAEKGADAALEAFLANGPAPVVFTLGSSAVVDAGSFFEQSLQAIRQLGCRAVLLVGDDQSLLRHVEERIFVASYAPFSCLFSRAIAVVHQGGIGTCGQALKAGVPSLIVPLGLDQPDNAFRMEKLGVARILPRHRYTAKEAAKHLSELMGTGLYRETALDIAAKLQLEQGVRMTCEAIEAVCEGSTFATVAMKSDLDQPRAAASGAKAANSAIS
jgi:rhamnosyltransferase subunit B